MFDLVIRNGTVIDGSGAPRRVADVAVQDGRIAAVDARLGPARREIDAAIGRARNDRKKMAVRSTGGKAALTRYRVLQSLAGGACAHVACRLATGRTHQIRVHLQFRRLPIVGDADYGGRPLLLSRLKPGYRLKPGQTERPLIDRVALHAERLEVTHPITGAPVVIEAPWPKDFSVTVKYLRKFTPTGAARAAAEAGVEDGEAV